jgi:hypothetical protein
MDTGTVNLTPAERRTWLDVLPHFAISRLPDKSLYFKCARCSLVFSYAAGGRQEAGPMHLKAHLARHGVHFTETAPAKRAKKPGVRSLDAAGRPTQSRFAFDAGPPSESE